MTKKNIGILTHYQVHNHGAVLQLYGLYHTLQNLGLAPCVLTYQKNFDFIDPALKNKYTFSLKSVPFYVRYLFQQGLAKTWFNFYKNRRLGQFKKRHFLFTAWQTPLDCAVVGSDEVFSLEAGINRMMYGYGVQSGRIFSYAASFGQTGIRDIEQKGCRDILAAGLKKFSHICVRDQASAETVENLIGQKPVIHFDPVLLYGFEKELANSSFCPPREPYLVVYAYDNHLNTPQEVAAVRSYARAHHLKIISPGFYHAWADRNLNVDPLELLQVFKHAACVVTDTFHGSVLSILTNRPFAACVREMNQNKLGFLLDSLGVGQARMSSWEAVPEILSRQWDWRTVNENIQRERAGALSYVKEALYD